MKNSQSNTLVIEKYLSGELSPMDQFLFESKLLLNPDLKKEVYFQKKTLQLVKMYHREKLKEELEVLHEALFNHPDKTHFKKSIQKLFSF